MRELYRHHNHALVSYYKSVLESEGIAVMMRNEYLTMSGLTDIPIPEFYPNICVMDEGDYSRAREILQNLLKKSDEDSLNSDSEMVCPTCGETNPGNFDFCYACQADLATK